MHLMEGTLPLAQAAAFTMAAIPFVAWSIAGERRPRDREGLDPERPSALLAGATSVLFAATLFPIPVPVAGATSHICLTPLFAMLLGVRRTIWASAFVLLVQALFFAHGGLTTLGANILTLGVVGPVVALSALALLRLLRVDPLLAVGPAAAVADLAVYVADAAILAVGLPGEAPALRVFGAILLGFAPVQMPLALLEGFLSFGVARALLRRAPGLLPERLRRPSRPRDVSRLLIGLLALALFSSCAYEGIDETVFAEAARAGGQAPRDALVDMSGGELGLALRILCLFGAGFLAGRAYQRVFGGLDADRR